MDIHHCVLCSKPVDLRIEPCDENGMPVHEDCYVNRITGKRGTDLLPLLPLVIASERAEILF
jgi:hypothetical protein